jgi:hypothetical protein
MELGCEKYFCRVTYWAPSEMMHWVGQSNSPYELCGWHYCDLCDACKNSAAAAAYASKATQFLFKKRKLVVSYKQRPGAARRLKWLMRSRKEGWAGLGRAFTQSRVCCRGVVFSSKYLWYQDAPRINYQSMQKQFFSTNPKWWPNFLGFWPNSCIIILLLLLLSNL